MKHILISVLVLCCLLVHGQNIVQNPDFSANGGSLDGWSVNAKTTYEFSNGEHLAFLNQEAALYQKITNIEPGSTYQVTISTKNLEFKQTSGYGYAIEKGTALILPDLTLGSTPLQNFCTTNSGSWNLLGDAPKTDAVLTFSVTVPQDATAFYLCIGTKGALAFMRVSSVVMQKAVTNEVEFVITDKTGITPLKDADITIGENPTLFFTDSAGKVRINFIPSLTPYRIAIAKDWYKRKTIDTVITNETTQIKIKLDDLEEVKKVETRISKYGDNATPYPLYGHFWNSNLNYNTATIDKITTAFDYIIGGSALPGQSIIEQMKAKDSLFQVIRYSGGWSSNYSYAEQNKMKLAYYRCGVLGAAINESVTTITLNAPPSNNGRGLLASEPGKFDIWLRIGNELMKVVTISSSTVYPITATVVRGFDGTTPASHPAGATATLPLYAGAAPVAGQTSTSRGYFIPVYGLRKEKLEADAQDAILNGGCDGIWIDILVGKLDARSLFDNKYDEWDHKTETQLSAANDIAYTKSALTDLYQSFYGRNGYYPVIYGNNVLYSQSLTSSARGWVMVKTTQHPKVMDGFCHENSWGHMTDAAGTVDNDGDPVPTENVFKVVGSNNHFLDWYTGSSWIDNCKAITLLAQNNLPNQPMTINAGFKNQWFAGDLTNEVRYNFNKYAYASYLMCVNVTADSLISTRMGISPMVNSNGTLSVNVEPFFYYPIGVPVQSYTSANFTNYRVGNANMYARKFSNGIVILNPFLNNMTTAMDINLITGDQRFYVDPENNNEPVTSVKLDSREAKILLVADNTPVHDAVLKKRGLMVYPAIVNNTLTLSFNDANIFSNNKIIYIYAVSGKLVRQHPIVMGIHTQQLNVSDMKPGVYFIRISGTDSTEKFIKE